MKNIDDFFGDDESQNVKTLIEVTKKFFYFVSQLTEIVDSLENSLDELKIKVDQLLTNPGVTAAIKPLSAPPTTSVPPPALAAMSAPPPAPAATSVPPGLPTPPAPATASAPPSSPASPPSSPSIPPGLPPLPGVSPAPQPSFGQPLAPQPSFGQPPTPQPAAPAPRASPMSLKAQMNMELKEAFARIKKGWDEDG
ncbi:MAG: hypothetical protein ACFFDT_24790 [Candidatus Hodarchaeota archaeon]